jgi:flagellar hook assembly protein FlgD
VTIHDVRGHLLRNIFVGVQSPGYHVARWDGRLNSGALAPSGVYYAFIVAADHIGSEKLTLIK